MHFCTMIYRLMLGARVEGKGWGSSFQKKTLYTYTLRSC